LPGRASFYRALDCFIRQELAQAHSTSSDIPRLTKNARNVILVKIGFNFNNIDMSSISPVDCDTINTLVSNGTLPERFLNLSQF
jgi:hypothetical protein